MTANETTASADPYRVHEGSLSIYNSTVVPRDSN